VVEMWGRPSHNGGLTESEVIHTYGATRSGFREGKGDTCSGASTVMSLSHLVKAGLTIFNVNNCKNS